jgi:NAD(P)-dependent dehydrogenase (short-subunit alcohol dehydrogenase family)
MSIERSIIITGAGSGIGSRTAMAVAGPGTGLVLHTRRNEQGLAAVAEAAEARGASVRRVLGDIGDAALPEALVSAARTAFGRVDQIVSNAGQAKRGGFGDMSAEDLEAALRTMPVAFFRMADAALPDLEASPWGRVVVISSFVAHSYGAGGLLFGATSAAKAALESLARTLAVRLAPSGTTVNAVAPGFTLKTTGGHSAAPQGEAVHPGIAATPRGKMGAPEDVAAAVAFLLSREAGHITGQTLHVDGGLLLR